MVNANAVRCGEQALASNTANGPIPAPPLPVANCGQGARGAAGIPIDSRASRGRGRGRGQRRGRGAAPSSPAGRPGRQDVTYNELNMSMSRESILRHAVSLSYIASIAASIASKDQRKRWGDTFFDEDGFRIPSSVARNMRRRENRHHKIITGRARTAHSRFKGAP